MPGVVVVGENRINVQWADPRRAALLMTFAPDWTCDDLQASMAPIYKLLDVASQPVKLIVDVRHSGPPPSGLIWRIWQISGQKHRNYHGLIVVGATPTIDMLVRLLLKVYSAAFQPSDFEFATSFDDALHLALK